MLLDALIVLVGFVPLVKGADMLVSGATSLARRLGVSTLLVGLTVVAFGTSMPELAVNVFAVLRGTTDIVIGNIVGSNIANIALILGVSAVLVPLRVKQSTVWKEIPFALLAVVLVAIMASDIGLGGMAVNVIGRVDGLVLLSLFIVFLYYVFGMAKNGKVNLNDMPKIGTRKAILYVIFGVLLLAAGGKVIVEGAVGLAAALGMSSRFIGLTVIAIGTSLPELVTSVVAALRKIPDLSVGNIVGSNIINVFFILGISATIAPLPISAAALLDIICCIIITLLLFLSMFVGQRHMIDRWQGVGLVAIYCAYIGYALVSGRL